MTERTPDIDDDMDNDWNSWCARAKQAQARAAEAAQRQHAKAWLDARQARPDHVEAAIEALEYIIASLLAGRSPEDVGPEIIRLGRLMARRT